MFWKKREIPKEEIKKRIEEIFGRGIVVDILPSKEELISKIASQEKMRVYIGADPTSDSLHLSHAKNYMFLEELRELGMEVIVLFGDFTAQIGDPTGRSDARPQLTGEQVKKNVSGWLRQISPLLNFKDKKNPPKILYNSAWLSKLSFKDVIHLASEFTVQQMIERDMFEKRWNANTPIHLHEFLYPLMQGYDSVAMDVDIELCGTDQTFNALAGRTLLKRLKNKDKFVITLNLMANPKTGELMSKSRGTGVFLSSPANEMFGAVMSQPDEMTEIILINNTRIPLSEIKEIMEGSPRDAKVRTAYEIVKIFYGEQKAKEAKENFISIFSKKEIPKDIDEAVVEDGSLLSDALVSNSIVKSKSEFVRLVKDGGVSKISPEEKKIEDIFEKVSPGVFRIGKHRFVKLKIK